MARLGPATDGDGAVDPRPAPVDLSHHLSRATKARHASAIKQFYKFFQIKGIAQLAGGLPNNSYFPFDTLEAKVARPDRWEPTPNKPVDPPPDDGGRDDDDHRLHAESAGAFAALSLREKHTKVQAGAGPFGLPQDAIAVPHTSSQPNPIKKIDLDSALQYGTAQGYPPLYFFVRQFTRDHMHPNCPYHGGPEVILTCGNTDGFSKCLSVFTNEWSEDKDWVRDKDGLLVEKFAYMSAVQAAKPRGLNIVPVEIDDEGMLAEGPGGLRHVLENWDFKKGRMPRLMYTVTMGQNPTSGVLSLHRRRQIYSLCHKYDILIIEDDPYWFLQYPSSTAINTTTTRHPSNISFNPDIPMFANGEPHPDAWKSTGYDFLDSLVPSYVSIDLDGRVLRLDTFSKTVAPGCRLGWITAQPALIERVMRVTETSTQQPSGFVQSLVAELMLGPTQAAAASSQDATASSKPNKPIHTARGWNADGWVRWLEGLRGNYERRMASMAGVLDEGRSLVKSGRRPSLTTITDKGDEEEDWAVIETTPLLSFVRPVGGMFLWLQIHFATHPLYPYYSKKSSAALLSRALWVFWTHKPYLVLVGPGSMFAPTEEVEKKEAWKFFRLCFAAIEADKVEDASRKLLDAARKFWEIKDRKQIEKLVEEGEQDVMARVAAEGGDGLRGMWGVC